MRDAFAPTHDNISRRFLPAQDGTPITGIQGDCACCERRAAATAFAPPSAPHRTLCAPDSDRSQPAPRSSESGNGECGAGNSEIGVGNGASSSGSANGGARGPPPSRSKEALSTAADPALVAADAPADPSLEVHPDSVRPNYDAVHLILGGVQAPVPIQRVRPSRVASPAVSPASKPAAKPAAKPVAAMSKRQRRK